MLQPQSQQPAVYNKHGMTSLETTTPPKKQKKSFGMRSILTVVGLSLFFIIAISGVLIAQRQRQVDAPVAPTAPVSQPSASTPAAPSPVAACTKTFDVAFAPGTNTPAVYACDTPCTDDYQCKDTTRGGKADYTCYRPTAGTAENWVAWLNVTEAVPDNTSSGYITSFSSYTRPDKSIKQYVVRDGKLYVRTSDANLGNWSGLIGPNSAMDATGTGTLTSFSAFTTPGTNKIQQHAVKGGRIWSRTSTDDVNWSAWEDHTANVAGIGTGAVISFTAYIMPNGSIRQFLVVGGQLYARLSDPTRTNWGQFEGPNTALAGVGSGDITSLSAYTKPDNSIKQFAVIGGALYTRDNAGGRCRLSANPTSATCEPIPGVAACTSKQAFTDYSTVTTATAITAATKLKPNQVFVYRVTISGATTAAVTLVDILPASLDFVEAPAGSGVTYDAATRKVTATFTSLTTPTKVVEFKVKVSATAAAGSTIKNTASITTGTSTTPAVCENELQLESSTVTPPNYGCNKPCENTAQCQDTTKGGNANYSCFNAGGTTGQVCRLTSNTASATCEAATTPPPAATPAPTPTIGCNQTCVSNADCTSSTHICYDTALVGQTYGKVCRHPSYVSSVTCTAPAVAAEPPTTTKGGQPALPAELPQTGPEDWLNWLKAGLITLGVGAALLLLL